MKALLLTHRLPYPPNRGDRIRAFHTLQQLSRIARVDLASVTDRPVSPAAAGELRKYCHRFTSAGSPPAAAAWKAAVSLARGKSATAGYFASAGLGRTLADWSADTSYDVVWVICSSMFPYAERLAGDFRLVVDLVDADSGKWTDLASSASWPGRWLYLVEAGRVRALERRVLTRADRVIVVSQRELQSLPAAAGAAAVTVVGNGVDWEYFSPAASPRPAPEQASTVLFVGVLNYAPNVAGMEWFCREVWPEVMARAPSAVLRLVGLSPGRRARRLARLPGVRLDANVPDVRPFLAATRLVVAPMSIARGVQNKVLEAIAMGKPVVATPQAIAGITAACPLPVRTARTREDWIAAVSDTLADGEPAAAVTPPTLVALRQELSWSAFGEQLRHIAAGDEAAGQKISCSLAAP